MQNKGAIRLFAIIFALVCLYQLSFTWVANRVRNKAAEYGKGDPSKELAYIDSVGKNVFLGFSYQDVAEREINLGLDLRGGMNVILEISPIDLMKVLSNNSQDSTFLKAIQLAKKKQKNSQEDFITLFGKSFKEIAPNASLASIFNTLQLKDRINVNTTDEEVLDIIRKETKDAIDNSFNILRTRIDRFGVTQPNIQLLEGSSGRILIELPGVKDPERVRRLLQGTANLEFWETYDVTELYEALKAADSKIKDINEAADVNIKKDTANITLTDSIKPVKDTSSLLSNLDSNSIIKNLDTAKTKQPNTYADFKKQYPLFALLRQHTDNNGQLLKTACVGVALASDTGTINKYLNIKQVRDLFPKEAKFLWSIKPYGGSENLYELVAIKVKNRDGSPALDGEVITNAREEFDQNKGSAEVTMNMNSEGAKKWALITRENIGKQIAIVLDNYVYSYPTVQGEIAGGSSQITGNFTVNEAKDLANVLKSGKLPAPARIIEDTVVGPTLGEESINAGLGSFIIAFLVVLAYMIFYYRKAGVAANIALVTNVFFIIGVLASLGAVLTLPGIAGLVLTLGMAVDANVIIYERIREELRAGKGLKLAIKDGFSNAYSAIIDGNVTTLLTAIILYVFGHGPIQGFATTLTIGILCSLFSAIFITRLIFEGWLNRNKTISFSSKLTANVFINAKYDFIAKRKIAYVISAIIIVIGIASLAFRGLSGGVDFVGGRSYVVKFEKPVSANNIASLLKDEFDGAPEVKAFGGDDQVKITTKYKIDEDDPNIDSEIESKLYQGLKDQYSGTLDQEKFTRTYILSSQKVGPTIADDIKKSSVWAVLFSLIGIFIYIAIRFKSWRYSLGGTVALAHDSIIVISLFSIFQGILPFSLDIDQAFIAAILTIIGYSINDTVIVFDRIREFITLHPKRDLKENMNAAVNSTLGRTLNTALTTLFVVFTIFIFGGEVIRGFVFALFIGIAVGTYSSIFIATSVAYDSRPRVPIVEPKEAKSILKKKDKSEKQQEKEIQ